MVAVARSAVLRPAANRTWGSPRIIAELHKVGIGVAKSTGEKYKPRGERRPSAIWQTLVALHVRELFAIDFFIVPTATFNVLFAFLVLMHQRRRVIHFNVTKHPTAQWTARQLVEAFPFDTAPRYLLRDGDGIYGDRVRRRIDYLESARSSRRRLRRGKMLTLNG